MGMNGGTADDYLGDTGICANGRSAFVKRAIPLRMDNGIGNLYLSTCGGSGTADSNGAIIQVSI